MTLAEDRDSQIQSSLARAKLCGLDLSNFGLQLLLSAALRKNSIAAPNIVLGREIFHHRGFFSKQLEQTGLFPNSCVSVCGTREKKSSKENRWATENTSWGFFPVCPTPCTLHDPAVCHNQKTGARQNWQGSNVLFLLSAEQKRSSTRGDPIPKAKSSQARGRSLGRGNQKNRQDLLCSAVQEGIALVRGRPQWLLPETRPDASAMPGPPGKTRWKP